MSYREGQIDLQRAQAWSNKIINKEAKSRSIFIPINHNQNHWLMIHVNLNTKQIEQYDSLSRHTNKNYATIIQDYLSQILKTTKHKWQTKQETIPQQNNGYDCGMYVLGNVQKILNPQQTQNTQPSRERLLTIINTGIMDTIFTENYIPTQSEPKTLKPTQKEKHTKEPQQKLHDSKTETEKQKQQKRPQEEIKQKLKKKQ